MAFNVTFATGKTVTIYNTAFLNSEQVRERAIALHGDRAYRYDEKTGSGRWFDIEVPAITRIEQMDEVYMGGGYCLVPVKRAEAAA